MSTEPKVILQRLDGNSFNWITVIAQPDTMVEGVVTATVLFGSYPVAAVTTDCADGSDYRMYPLVETIEPYTGGHNQSYLAFLVEIGALSDESAIQDYMDGMGRVTVDDLFERYGDNGYNWVNFLGEVARAIHTAYPDITPEPSGF